MFLGTILRRGLSIGEIPPTPTEQQLNLSLTEPKKILLEAASEYGFPISFIQEQNGALIQNIFPIRKTEEQQISTSSKTELALHTEAAFHPYKPKVVLLLCLRGDPNAVTTYANIDDIAERLKPETLSTLTQLWFTTSIDESFRTNGEKDMELTCSVLKEVVNDDSNRRDSKTDPVYTICYDETLTKGINEQAVEALRELKEAIRECTSQVVLEAGDLLVLNNDTTVHGRLPFKARYDGTDRWIQRILAIQTLPPRDHLDGLVITTRFGQF